MGGQRLPTNEEWQYAALGNDGRTYPGGTDPPSVRRLNACGGECAAMALRVLNTAWPVVYKASDSWEATAPVGSFSDGASPFGALDMEGNVKEWTGSLTGVSSSKPGAADANRPRIVRGSGWTASHPTDFGELATTRRGPPMPQCEGGCLPPASPGPWLRRTAGRSEVRCRRRSSGSTPRAAPSGDPARGAPNRWI